MYARCINISMATPWLKKEAFLYRVNVTILLLFTWNYCPGVLHNVCILYEVWAACLTLHPSAEFHENLNSISFVILQTIKPNHSPWWSAWQHNSGRRKEGFYVKSVEERSSIQPLWWCLSQTSVNYATTDKSCTQFKGQSKLSPSEKSTSNIGQFSSLSQDANLYI